VGKTLPQRPEGMANIAGIKNFGAWVYVIIILLIPGLFKAIKNDIMPPWKT